MKPPDEEDEDGSRQLPSEEVVDAAKDLLANVELLDIRPTSLSASLAEGVGPGTHVDEVRMDVALSYAAEEGIYGNRFDYSFELVGQGETLGEIKFSIVIDYGVEEGFVPATDAADFVTSTTGYFAAYPYARELFQSLVARLQFDPVVLGMLKRGSMRPGSITLTPHRYADDSRQQD